MAVFIIVTLDNRCRLFYLIFYLGYQWVIGVEVIFVFRNDPKDNLSYYNNHVYIVRLNYNFFFKKKIFVKSSFLIKSKFLWSFLRLLCLFLREKVKEDFWLKEFFNEFGNKKLLFASDRLSNLYRWEFIYCFSEIPLYFIIENKYLI